MQCTLFADGFPVFPTVCPPICSQWKPSTSLNPNSLCVFTHVHVCCCGSALCKSLSTLASLTIVSGTCPTATVISSNWCWQKRNVWLHLLFIFQWCLWVYVRTKGGEGLRLDNLASHNTLFIYFFHRMWEIRSIFTAKKPFWGFVPIKVKELKRNSNNLSALGWFFLLAGCFSNTGGIVSCNGALASGSGCSSQLLDM